jgi:tRNA pseudouridine38-40 synthase
MPVVKPDRDQSSCDDVRSSRRTKITKHTKPFLYRMFFVRFVSFVARDKPSLKYSPMPTFKITLAYDGTDFVGWQRQANGPSIQGLLEEACLELDGRAVTVNGAGRTDAGVHALGQVASCSLERRVSPDVVVRALNARLPPGVRVLSAVEARPEFHARFDARAKTYRYRIWNAAVLDPFERRYAWHLSGPLDVEALGAAASLLEGRHDFAGFQASGSAIHTTERTIRTSVVTRTGPLLSTKLVGFLRTW